MSDVVFEIEAGITLDADDFEKDLEGVKKSVEDLDKEADSVGKTVKSTLSDFGKGLLSGIADEAYKNIDRVRYFVSDVIEAAAELDSEDKRFARTFSDMADEASKAISNISKETNVYGRLLKNSATKSFVQFTGAGIEAADAIRFMEEHLQIAADAASYYNLSIDEVNTKLLSFYRGNTEAGDMIGLFTSQLQRNEKSIERYGEEWKNLNEAQRQLVMKDITREIYEQSQVLGAAAENGENYETILNNFRSIKKEIQGQIGMPLLKAITPVFDAFNDMLAANPELLEKLANSMAKLAEFLLNSLVSIGEWIAENGEAILSFLSSMFGFTDGGFQTQEYLGITKETGVYTSVNGGLHGGGSGEIFAIADVLIDEDSEKLVQEQLDSLDLSAIVTMKPDMSQVPKSVTVDVVSGASAQSSNSPGGGASGKKFDVGLDYVPYDEFPAILHEGEAVLTKVEATAWRRGETTGSVSINYDRLGSIVASAVAEAVSGLAIQMDKQTVGSIVSPVVFREMGRQLGSKRFAT